MNTRRERQVIILTDALKARFFAKTAKAESGCLLWTGAVTQSTGYGKFRLSDGASDAHVVAWRFANNGVAVPVGKLVMHSCDNRQCVNHEHLILGTTSDNMIDCRNKGRLVYPIGEQTHNAKLDPEKVAFIREHYKPRVFGYRRIGELLNVSEGTVRAVVSGRNWKHLQPTGGAK